MISICVRVLQPWRIEVPTQSVPVSPPPNTMHVLALRGDGRGIRRVLEHRLRAHRQEIHGEVHALEIAAFDGQIARHGGAGADHGGVEVPDQQLGLDVLADGRIAQELDAFLLQQRMRRATTSRLSSFMFGMP